jgi:hypothetical protein
VLINCIEQRDLLLQDQSTWDILEKRREEAEFEAI